MTMGCAGKWREIKQNLKQSYNTSYNRDKTVFRIPISYNRLKTEIKRAQNTTPGWNGIGERRLEKASE